jgi:uncharacterized protein
MKVRKIPIFIALVAVLLLQASCNAQVVRQNALTIETKNNGPVVFNVELAVTDAEKNKGLMNRASLAEDSGMLFIWEDVEQRTFWMKNTLIPLDMIFIAEDGIIHHIHHMARPLDQTRITSEGPSRAVLEINGGLTDILGITEGDKVIHPVFRNQLAE